MRFGFTGAGIALLLVVIVVIIFLQTWRASIIPLAAVPVSLVGTFAAMLAFGFSINNLSLFGLVLAIGIVVDDAIVVVENVERNIALGLSPADAAKRAMSEVTSPIIATALVLCAVFVPVAYITGLQGAFYQYGDGLQCCVGSSCQGNPCTVNGCCWSGSTVLDTTYAAWGCGLGLELNSTGGSVPVGAGKGEEGRGYSASCDATHRR